MMIEIGTAGRDRRQARDGPIENRATEPQPIGQIRKPKMIQMND